MASSEPNANASPSGSADDPQYKNRKSRISKEDAFMVLAIWMEQSPLAKAAQTENEAVLAEAAQTENIAVMAEAAQTENEAVLAEAAQTENEAVLEKATQTEIKVLDKGTQTERQVLPQTENKAGAVLVTEDNRLYAVDCTRDGVHAMVRLLMKHSQKLKNSTIYISRRPCSFCAKLLVQCGVRRLYYLPTEPENADEEDLHKVDNLLKVAPLAHSYFVPNVDEKVAHEAEENTPKTGGTPKKVTDYKDTLMAQFWKNNWMKQAKQILHWSAFDEIMRPQIYKDFDRIMKWISQVTLKARDSHDFIQFKGVNDCDHMRWDELELNEEQKNLYRHLLAMAQILAQRTDDPKTGVGAVIWKESEEQIVATGWNGFPAKALYGEFPRASDRDKAASLEQKKYPYVIHAEQNALLMKNAGDISGSTLFVTKVPCHECVPLLKLEKVNKCVIGITQQQAVIEFERTSQNASYTVFAKEVKKETFTCFVVKETKPPADPKTAKKLTYSEDTKRHQQDPSTEQSS